MRTISVVASNRPEYTIHALGGIAKSLMMTEEGSFDKLIVCIDPRVDGSHKNVEFACEHVITEILGGMIDCYMYTNIVTMGVGGNHQVALQRAFEEHESNFNIMIEDDAVITNDALPLTQWFADNHGGMFSDYLLLSLCNHRAFGRGQNPGLIPDDPGHLVDAFSVTSPFAWAASKYKWPFIKATWNRKHLPPNGWDWSLAYYMNRTHKRAMHPVVSRCRNIGREGGYNETPESFDKTQTGLIYSEDYFDGKYQVVGKIEDEELGKIDPWMTPELRRMFPA